jgi:hypothetical protein
MPQRDAPQPSLQTDRFPCSERQATLTDYYKAVPVQSDFKPCLWSHNSAQGVNEGSLKGPFPGVSIQADSLRACAAFRDAVKRDAGERCATATAATARCRG